MDLVPDLLAGAQYCGLGADFASYILEPFDELRKPFLVLLVDIFLCTPNCDPDVIDKCTKLGLVLDVAYVP